MLRRLLAVTAASAVVLTGLVGCSSPNESAAPKDCRTPLQPGMLSENVTLTDITEGVPRVTVTGGTDIVNAQLSQLRAGEGSRTITGGELVSAIITVFDASTGAMVLPTQTRFLEAMPEKAQSEFLAYLQAGATDNLSYTDLIMGGVLCHAPGDVLAIAATPQQALTSGYTEDAIVIVVEILSAGAMQAEGAARALPWGFPALTQDATGRPGIVLPPQQASADLRSATAIQGSGDKLTAEQSGLGNVLTVGWNDKKVRSNSWEQGLVQLGSEGESRYSFRAELTGVPLGSRVVILDPNNGDPLVHVVDVLSAG